MENDEILDRVTLSDGSEMVLLKWDEHIAIEVNKRSLMSSHDHASEDALGRIVGERVQAIAKPRILIGGLGLAAGRNNHGRITSRFRGGGHKQGSRCVRRSMRCRRQHGWRWWTWYPQSCGGIASCADTWHAGRSTTRG